MTFFVKLKCMPLLQQYRCFGVYPGVNFRIFDHFLGLWMCWVSGTEVVVAISTPKNNCQKAQNIYTCPENYRILLFENNDAI